MQIFILSVSRRFRFQTIKAIKDLKQNRKKKTGISMPANRRRRKRFNGFLKMTFPI